MGATNQGLHDAFANPGDDLCADSTSNQAPTVTTPVMEPIVIEGVKAMAGGEEVPNTAMVAGVKAYFSDPDGDDLEFTVGSDNTDAATGMLDDEGNLVITAHDVGEATITVTATDSAGAKATSTVMVTVRLSPAERYNMTPAGYEFDAPATEQVTFTVSAVDADDTSLDEDATVSLLLTQYPAAASTKPLVTRVIGLDSSLDSDITDDNILQGLLTVRATDPDGERGFTVYFQCSAPGERVTITMFDEEPQLVDEATIRCKAPVVVGPPDRDDLSDQFTVSSYGDWMYHNVTDGYIVTALEGNNHLVNEHPTLVKGWITRDEPVMHQSYTLGVSDVERLQPLSGGAPRRAKADAEEGQRTIEVLVGAPHVQLTVTSKESGPAYIRFLDKDMNPFGTDVDEEPMHRGADVVGLDSQSRLAMNVEMELSSAMALVYDQYVVTTPGDLALNSYLTGNEGTYNQGKFRFFNPCPQEVGAGHNFYVQVYEKDGKYLETIEKVVCINPPGIVPSKLSVTTFSDRPGHAKLEWVEAIGATAHHVIVLDMTNPTQPLPVTGTYQNVAAPVTMAGISGLSEDVEYRFAVAAERRDASGQVSYSMPSFIDQRMDWE